MLKRIGNLTVAASGWRIAVYWNVTPYHTRFAGVNLDLWWRPRRGDSPGVRAWVVGPVVVGACNINWLYQQA